MSALDAAHLTDWEIIGRLAVGLGLGAAIGLERELDGHDAGLRTHALLTMGSAMFGLLSVGAFSAFIGPAADSNVQVDVSRIASYLVAGVGFLAGGAIVKHHDRVRGLTTAASLWMSAAIGLAAGLGLFAGAVIATAGTLAVLLSERPVAWILRRPNEGAGTIRAVTIEPVDIAELLSMFDSPRGTKRAVSRTTQPDGRHAVIVSGVPIGQGPDMIRAFESQGATEVSWTEH